MANCDDHARDGGTEGGAVREPGGEDADWEGETRAGALASGGRAGRRYCCRGAKRGGCGARARVRRIEPRSLLLQHIWVIQCDKASTPAREWRAFVAQRIMSGIALKQIMG
jgi:hypothetical protein